MTVIQQGLASGLSHDLASIFGQVYRVNGWDRMAVWDGFTDSAVSAGIEEPPTGYSSGIVSTALSPASGLTAGAHLVRYRYVNSKTQYPSNPSENLIVSADVGVSNTGASYRISNIDGSPDAKVDRIVVEMTDAAGTQFFIASVIANATGSITLQTDDDTLRGRQADWDDFGHDIPPYFKIVEPHGGRLWGLGQIVYTDGTAEIAGAGLSVVGVGTVWTSAATGRFILLSGDERRFIESVVSNKLMLLEESGTIQAQRNYRIMSEVADVLKFSRSLYPESWPPENQIRVIDGKPETAKAIKGYRTDLILYGERSMERLVYSDNPFIDGKLEAIPGERGAASRLVVQDVEGMLYGLDYKGIHAYGGDRPVHISEPIDPYFDPGDTSQGSVDFSVRTTFHSVHYPARHQIAWFVVLNGVPGDGTVYTKPQHAIVYDYKNNAFTVWRFDVPMVASTIGPGADGTSQTLLADENGRLWSFGIGTTDGVHPTAPITSKVKSGATASEIRLSGSVGLYVDNVGLQGAMAYWSEGDALGLITSNSASGFSLSGSGFVTAPSAGDTIHFGRIPISFKSKAFTEDPASVWREVRYLNLAFEPQAAGSIRVRFYLNRSSTAFSGYSENYSDAGITQTATDDYFVVDVTRSHGNARIPIPSSDGSSVFTIEFEIETVSATPFELTGFSLDGYQEEEDLQV